MKEEKDAGESAGEEGKEERGNQVRGYLTLGQEFFVIMSKLEPILHPATRSRDDITLPPPPPPSCLAVGNIATTLLPLLLPLSYSMPSCLSSSSSHPPSAYATATNTYSNILHGWLDEREIMNRVEECVRWCGDRRLTLPEKTATRVKGRFLERWIVHQ